MEHNKKIILESKVYFVSSEKDETVLLAMDVEINENEKTVKWFDTVKERLMYYELIVDSDHKHLVFERLEKEGGEIYTFIPLTLEIYDEKVKNRILIPKDFEFEEEMLKAFEETKNNAW